MFVFSNEHYKQDTANRTKKKQNSILLIFADLTSFISCRDTLLTVPPYIAEIYETDVYSCQEENRVENAET